MEKDIEILAKRKIAAEDARIADETRKAMSDAKLELANRGWGMGGGAGVARIHAIGRRDTKLRAQSAYQSYKEAFVTAGVPLTEPVLRECADQALPYYDNAAQNIGGSVRRQCGGINDLDQMLAALNQEVERDRHDFVNQIEIECTEARLKAKEGRSGDNGLNGAQLTLYERIERRWKNNPIIVTAVIALSIIGGIKTVVELFSKSPVVAQPASRVIRPAAQSTSPVAQPTSPPRNAAPETSNVVPREPVLDLGIGQPFGSSTLITLKNSGVEELINIVVNLRCFLLTASDDLHPDLLFDGFPSIDNANSWWVIKSLSPGETATKEAVESMESYLKNKEKLETSASQQSRGPFVSRKTIIAVDVDFQRRSDRKRFSFSGLAELFKDGNTGEPFTRPLPMSEFYRRLLDTVKPPNYRSGPAVQLR